MIRITKKLESDTLFVPELRPWLGSEVEIIVREADEHRGEPTTEPFPLRGSIVADDDPFGPAVSPDAWEAIA